MKYAISTITLLLFAIIVFGQEQTIVSGNYDSGLKLSYDSKTNKLTGYFESYTGFDEQTNKPRFSCVFYLEGDVVGQKFKVKTYYPLDKSENLIEGTVEIIDNKAVKIKLPEEHGGCRNVLHFADEPVKFKLEKSYNFVQIRYVDVDKAYFFSEKSNNKKLRAYLLKGDFVSVEKIEQGWVYCTYFGKKTTKAWFKLSDLNKL